MSVHSFPGKPTNVEALRVRPNVWLIEGANVYKLRGKWQVYYFGRYLGAATTLADAAHLVVRHQDKENES